MKILVGENDDRILGFTMIGAAAGEVMAVVQMTMLAARLWKARRRYSRAPNEGRGTRHAAPNMPRRSLRHVTRKGRPETMLLRPLTLRQSSSLQASRAVENDSGNSARPTTRCPFQEGDELHPAFAKIHSAHPLDDRDQWSWLAKVAAWIDGCRRLGTGGVITCSALRRSYRDFLTRGRPEVRVVICTARGR